MADKKISALTSASTPLAGTEVLPIVQSSSTVKVSVANLTAGRAVSMSTLAVGVASPSTTAEISGAPATLRVTGTSGTVPQVQIVSGGVVNWSLRTNQNGGSDFTLYQDSTERILVASGGDTTIKTGNLIQGTSGKGLTTSGSFDLGLGANGSTSAVYVNTSNKLLVNTNSNGFSAYCAIKQTVAADDTLSLWNSATSGNNVFVGFFTDGGVGRGSIDYDRAGGLVRYNTTSDYRAKDIIGPVQNVGATIDALKVYEGVMKGATRSRPMLIAHEAQEHVPYAVSGVKDDVKDDGSPRLQQMDVSSLVPLLLAEIQLLRARVATLEQQSISKG